MDLKNMLNVASLAKKKYIDQIKQIHKDIKIAKVLGKIEVPTGFHTVMLKMVCK